MPGAIKCFQRGVSRLFFVETHLLDREIVAVNFQVQVNPVSAVGGCQVADTILVAVFAACAFVYLAKRLGFVRVEKSANHINGFCFRVHLFFFLNGDFHVVGKELGKCVGIAGIKGVGDCFEVRIALIESKQGSKQQQKKQISHYFSLSLIVLGTLCSQLLRRSFPM